MIVFHQLADQSVKMYKISVKILNCQNFEYFIMKFDLAVLLTLARFSIFSIVKLLGKFDFMEKPNITNIVKLLGKLDFMENPNITNIENLESVLDR